MDHWTSESPGQLWHTAAAEVATGQLRDLQERHNILQQDSKSAKNELAAVRDEAKGLKVCQLPAAPDCHITRASMTWKARYEKGVGLQAWSSLMQIYRDRMIRWMEQCPTNDMPGTSYR